MPTENRSSNVDMVSVPREPTEEMIVAFAEAWYSKRQTIDDPDMLDAYKAMLAVAPAEQHQGEPVHMVRTHGSDCWEEISGESLELCQADTAEYEVRKLYPRPGSGEVEQLRAEVKRLELLVSQGDHDYDMYRANFDRQLAERDALLRKAWRGPRTDEDCAAIDAALSASEKPSTPASCTWTYNNNSFAWDTNCANSFTLMEDGPKENGMKFCPYCSKPILQAPHDTES